MEATLKDDASSPQGDAVVRLRVDVYDRILAARGITTVVAAAELHRINRAQLFDYRSGRAIPLLSTAMKMADDLDTTVDMLFEHRPGGESRG
jgi:hypothetical protein